MATMQYGGIVEQIANTAAAGGTTTLVNTSKQIQVLTASGSNGQTYVLPNASTMAVGQKFEFYNTATGLLTIQYNNASTFTTVNPSSSAVIKLDNNGTTNGTWVTLSSGSAVTPGTKNYMAAVTTTGGTNIGNGNFETGSTTGWSLVHSALALTNNFPSATGTAGSAFTTSNGGSPASGSLTISPVSSGQLSGSYSLSYNQATSNTVAGDMLLSSAFYIDTEDQAKVMQIKFYYKAVANSANLNFSGTSSNSFGVAIYDVTNGAWIMPAGVWNIVQGSGVGYCTATFQTTSNSTQYQLAVFNANATTSGAVTSTMYFDDFFVGPQTAPTGPAMTDWVSFTPSWSANAPTWSINAGKWRRVGDSMEINFDSIASANGSAGNLLLTIPTGVSIDSTKISSLAGANSLLQGVGIYVSATADSITNVGYNSTTQVSFVFTGASVSAILGSNFGNNFQLSGNFYVPIVGWSSNTAMSSDTDTRIVAMQVQLAAPTATINSSLSLVKFTSGVLSDSHASFSTSTGYYTCPVSGYYRVSAGLAVSGSYTAGQYTSLAISKNSNASGNFLDSIIAQTTATVVNPNISGTILCNAGDTLAPYIASTASGPTVQSNLQANYFNVERLSGPAVVAATESVNASYAGITGGPITINATPSVIPYSTKSFDSHNAYNTTSGIYTIPVTGKYLFTATFACNSGSTPATNQNIIVYIAKAGSIVYTLASAAGSGGAINQGPSGSGIVSCNAGDQMAIYGCYSGGNFTIGSGVFSVARIGN